MIASSAALVIGYVLFLWWFSTSVVLYANGLAEKTHRFSFGATTLALLLALYGVFASSASATPLAAVIAFTSALVIWGWHEMCFLLGIFVGPRRDRCSPECRGWRHFLHGFEALLYHEVGLLLTASGLTAWLWGAPNRVALFTFVALWAMRISSKLNLFLGVPNPMHDWLPAKLRYLGRYIRKARMNSLLPFSVAAMALMTLFLVRTTLAPNATPFEATQGWLLAALVGLGALEHALLVLPISTQGLWRWGMRSREARSR